MVCKQCVEAAMSAYIDPPTRLVLLKKEHPKGCGCDCQHRLPTVTSVLSRLPKGGLVPGILNGANVF